MTPYWTYLKVLLVGLLCAACLVGGYKWGSSDLADVKAEYQQYQDKVSGVSAAQEYILETLKKANTELSIKYAAADLEAQKRLEKARTQWDQLSASKDSTIKDLRGQISKKETALQELQAQLLAELDPEKRRQLEEQIKNEQQTLGQTIIRAQSLQCLAVPIPVEYINLVNSYETASNQN